jgi:medium-chain acyl-[acyl-carrier-protein] hydrolase
MIEALAGALQPFLDRPAAIFGHGLGALIGFEFARFLRKNSNTQLKHLLVAGRRAPQIPGESPPRYNLPEPEFIDALKELDDIPAEVLEHPELMQLMLPMLRADFMLAETYAYQAEPPLDTPISVYGGLKDTRLSREQLESWREQTTAAFKLQTFPGGHFFVQSAQSDLLEAIARELAAG